MRLLSLLLVLATATFAQARPAACQPDGNLDYYRYRAADFVQRNPGVAPPDYYLDYADVYVRRFSAETQPLLSPEGQAWMDRARVNLQVAMESRRLVDPEAFAQLERDPGAFRAFGFHTHTLAYRDAGIEELTLRDLILIGVSPDAQDLFTSEGLGQLLAITRHLGDSCRKRGLRRCLHERALRERRELMRRLRDRWGLRPTGRTTRFVLRRLRDSLVRLFTRKPREAISPGALGGLARTSRAAP